MKKKLVSDIKINTIITILVGMINFLINKYFSEYMGVELLGLMRLFSQIIACLSLTEMGLGTASTYALYKPLSEKNQDQINIVVSTIDFFYKKVAIIVLIIGLFINIFLNKFIQNSNYGYMLNIYWSLYIINTSFTYYYGKYQILFTANQEFKKVRLIQGTGRVIFQILRIIAIIQLKSFLVFIILMIMENMYIYILYRKHYYKNYIISKVKNYDKNIIKDTKYLFWHKLGEIVVFNTDYIILSKFISLSIVGIYSSYLIINQMIMTIIRIVTNVLSPTIGKFVTENNEKNIFNKWKDIYIGYFYMSVFLIISMNYLINPFVKLWLGEEYILSKITVYLILINLFIQIVRNATDIFKTALGFFNDLYVPLLEGALNLIFSLILVQKIGVNGVIIGTIISNVLVILILKPLLVFQRCFNKRVEIYIIILIKYIFFTFMSYLLCNFFIKKILKINLDNINNWWEWIISSISVSIVSIIIITLVFSLDKEFRKILGYLKKEEC